MKTSTDDLTLLRLELRLAFRVHASRKLTFPGFLALAAAWLEVLLGSRESSLPQSGRDDSSCRFIAAQVQREAG